MTEELFWAQHESVRTFTHPCHWVHLDTARLNSMFLRALKVEEGSTGVVPYGGRTPAVRWNGERHERKQNCFPLKQTRKLSGFGNAWTFPTDFTQKYIKVWFGVTATCHWKITFSPQIIYRVSRSDLSLWSLPWKQNKSKQQSFCMDFCWVPALN